MSPDASSARSSARASAMRAGSSPACSSSTRSRCFTVDVAGGGEDRLQALPSRGIHRQLAGGRSPSSGACRGQFVVQPRTRECPVPAHRRGGGVQRRRRLIEAQPAEEAAFDHPSLALVEPFQASQRVAQRDQIVERLFGDGAVLVERERLGAASALCRASTHGVIDQHVAHRARGDRVEVRAAAPVDALERHELEERLVHELGGGERVANPFAPQAAPGHAPQLLVHARQQQPERRRIACGMRLQQRRNLGSAL